MIFSHYLQIFVILTFSKSAIFLNKIKCKILHVRSVLFHSFHLLLVHLSITETESFFSSFCFSLQWFYFQILSSACQQIFVTLLALQYPEAKYYVLPSVVRKVQI